MYINRKKGQGATEYMIVLAVVIIIGLIVIGILRNVPASGAAAKARASKAYWESADIGITDYAIDGSGLKIYVRNNFARDIEITNIKFGTTSVYTTNTVFRPGEIKELTSTSITCTAGRSYSYSISIDYTELATTSSFTFDSATDLVGTCAD
jgi:hypothetical protein